MSVLGIGCLIIVIFAQRLKDLADKQMLFVTGVSHQLERNFCITIAAEDLSEGVVTRREK